jgi:hypothetical protein
MKATMKTTIMLMAMTIGTLAASAQSAQRGTPHSEQQRKSTPASSSRSQRSEAVKSNNRSGQRVSSKSTTRKNNAVRSSYTRQEPNRQVNSRSNTKKNNAVRSSSTRQEPNMQVTTRTSTQKPQANRSNNVRRSDPRENQRNANLRNSNRKVSTTTRNNPRSDYRSPNRTVNAGKTRLDPKSRATQTNRTSHVVVDRNNNSRSHANNRHYYPAKKVKMHVHPRVVHNNYRVMYYPAHREVIWTSRMHRYYVDLYPGYVWGYNTGYHIQTISAFETRYNVGEVARVYGRVYATWYNRESDDLLLFFGGEFPHQEFTMVIPGHIARRYNWRPERYFLGQHILATGLITSYDGSPEMIIKNKNQMDIY